MKMSSSQLGDAQVFTLTGRLDSEATPEFERQCLKEIRGETMTLILDLSGLEYLSSAGLRTILSNGKTLQAKEGKLVLCVPKGQTRQIVEAVGFHMMFIVCGNLEEAGKHVAFAEFAVIINRSIDANRSTFWIGDPHQQSAGLKEVLSL